MTKKATYGMSLTAMGNLIVGIPIGGTHGATVRPYVLGGIGILRATAKASDFADKLSNNGSTSSRFSG